eukprot:750229-Hanusia_phi.AAC.3
MEAPGSGQDHTTKFAADYRGQSTLGYGEWFQCTSSNQSCTRQQSCSSSELYLRPANIISAGEITRISFQIRNALVEQQAVSPSISVRTATNANYIPKTSMSSSGSLVSSSFLGLQTGDFSPLVILKKRFAFSKISQSSSRPGDLNSITVSLVPSVLLTAKNPATFISISNLMGAKSAQGKLAIQSPLKQLVDPGSNPQEAGQGYGYWNDEDKSLTLRVVDDQGIAAGQLFAFSFTIKNPWALTDQNMRCSDSASLCIGLQLKLGDYSFSDTFGVVSGVNEAMNVKVRP